MREEAVAHLARCLVAYAPARLALFRLENDLVDAPKRLHTLARRLADLVEGQKEWRDKDGR